MNTQNFFMLLAGLLGLVTGSFLNVVIVRLPLMLEREWEAQWLTWRATTDGSDARSASEEAATAFRFDLAWPPSHCPVCSHRLRWYENVPVFSWLWLRGQCGHCSVGIHWHYPGVELATAVLFVGCAWGYGTSPTTIAGMGLCAALLILAVIDVRTLILPDSITLPLLWAGLLLNTSAMFTPLSDAVWGAAVGYGGLWVLFYAFKLVTGKHGVGFGDLKLCAALGAWFGLQALDDILLLAALAGLVVGGMQLAAGLKRRGAALPFGPHLAGAGIFFLFARLSNVDWLSF